MITPDPQPLENLEAYTKGRSDMLDEILSKTIGDQHTYLMEQHDTAIRKEERMILLKDLQKFIDSADSRVGCPNGTLGIAYLVRWMGGQGYDCD